MRKIILWLIRHSPRIVTKDKLDMLKFRATWHCPSCSEEHDRNQYGR